MAGNNRSPIFPPDSSTKCRKIATTLFHLICFHLNAFAQRLYMKWNTYSMNQRHTKCFIFYFIVISFSLSSSNADDRVPQRYRVLFCFVRVRAIFFAIINWCGVSLFEASTLSANHIYWVRAKDADNRRTHGIKAAWEWLELEVFERVQNKHSIVVTMLRLSLTIFGCWQSEAEERKK